MTVEHALDRRSRVTVVGAGVIGLSWAALFLDHGLHVCITDPAPDVDATTRAALADHQIAKGWEQRLRFEPELAAAVRDAHVIQENGPDRIAFKQDLWRDVEAACPPDALLLSSSSGIPATRQAKKMTDPSRLLVGHPFNPPHILPLVEVVPGPNTPPETAEQAMAFYAAVGKHPVLIAKEVPGFVANRLQAALLRECFWLVRAGAATPAQIDEIMTTSLGPRWAADGPFASATMGGGAHGFAGFLDHFGRGLQLLWVHTRLRPLVLTPRLRRDLIAQTSSGPGETPVSELEARRDTKLRAVLDALRTTRQ